MTPDLLAVAHATPTALLLNLVGGVCLFLYGLRQIRRGLMRAFGARLRGFVAACTVTRLTGFFSGAVSALFLQSSIAVTVILASFMGQKMVGSAAAMAVMLGADVGVTIVALVLSFNISWLGPLLLLVGLMVFGFFDRRSPMLKNIGLAVFGLGLMMFSLGWLRMASVPLAESSALPYLLKPLEIDPVLTLVVAAVVTWMIHSGLAFIMLVAGFAHVGVISPQVAMHLVLGANVGGALIPLFATLRDEPTAIRLPFSALMMRLTTALILLAFLDDVMPLIAELTPDAGQQAIFFHVCFAVLLGALFLPLTDVVAWVVERLIPDRAVRGNTVTPQYLDYKQLEIPTVALASAARETLRMADMVQEMMTQMLEVFRHGNEKAVRAIQEKDSGVDALHRALKHYLAQAMELSLEGAEARRHLQIIDFATTLEHVGDSIDKSMAPMALRLIHHHRKFSPQGLAEIEHLFGLVIDSMRLAQTVFMTSDPALARQLVEGKEKVSRAERQASSNHFARLREGVPESIETSSIHLDLLRDLQRINADLATVAYPILQETGELLPNRLTYPRLTSLEPNIME